MNSLLNGVFVASVLAVGMPTLATVRVVVTDTNLASIANEIGGNRVVVESLSRSTDDPHHVEPTGSMVSKVAHANVVARIGMDFDTWLDGVLEKSGNDGVSKGGKGYADCSANLRVQEIPPAKLDPSMGDIHVYGNPHYLMDPANGILAAGNIAAALIRVDPAGQPYYNQRFLDFGAKIKEHLAGWRTMLAPYKGSLITTYHRSWVYFVTRFGLKEFGTIEPKPGIQPSQGHVNDLIREMKADKVKAMLVEEFRSHRFPDLIQGQTGAKAVYVPLSVGADPAATDYIKLFDVIVGRLAEALK
ncbi:MAG: metal ABC transporter substrate-binding protein [Chthonomonadales bacterium]